jgi:hypothetical protein
MSGEGGNGRKRPSAAGGNGAAGKRREPLNRHGPGAAEERQAVVEIDVGHPGTGWAVVTATPGLGMRTGARRRTGLR